MNVARLLNLRIPNTVELTRKLTQAANKSSIDFYHMPESPPSRAVEMVAGMVGVDLNKKYLNLFAREHIKGDFPKLNPFRKVPFIVDGDLKMGESRAIMMYLVSKYQPDNEFLYPKDLKKRALIDELLFYDIGTYYQASTRLLQPMLLRKVPELNKEDEEVFKRSLKQLDKKLAESGKKFMLGDNLTIADISMAASFTWPHSCGYSLNEYKNLVSYEERLKSAIPNYSAINDEPVKNMTMFIQAMQNS